MRATIARIGLLCLLAGCVGTPPEVVTLREAEVWVGRSQTPPGPDVAWEPATLPDRWMAERRRVALGGWYRMRLPRPEPGAETWGLLARVYPNAAFFVNGIEVGRGGRMEPGPEAARANERVDLHGLRQTLDRDRSERCDLDVAFSEL